MTRSLTRPPRRLLTPVLVLALSLGPGLARADYLVASGDVLDVTVFRAPDLSHEVRVDVDGKIAFPPIGRVDVAGQTLDSVAGILRDALNAEQILNAPRVTVALAQTRPVFVGGDVAAPGAYPYQSGLTVRRALALAGGLGFARAGGAEEAARLGRERAEAALALLRQRTRLARVSAELDGAESFDPAPDGAAAAGPERAEILALEARRFVSDQAGAAAEKAHLARAVELAQARVAALADERALQARLEDRQTAEIDRIRDIQERGLASQARVTEEQRVLDSVQERAAANETEMAAAREGLETATYALDQFDATRRAALEAEKQDALTAIESGAASLAALDRRLAALGVSELGRIRVTVYPAGEAAPGGVPADFATLLAPGDTLEITLDPDQPLLTGPETGAATPAASPGASAAAVDSSGDAAGGILP